MPTDPTALLVSLKPHFAEMILSGKKTVELRRVRPEVEPGAILFLYASSPRMALLGIGRVEAIESASPAALWQSYGTESGLSRDQFDSYLNGLGEAVAITMRDVERLPEPRSLAELRRCWHGFRPPQSFRYIDPEQAKLLHG